jgi:hypothetical protein
VNDIQTVRLLTEDFDLIVTPKRSFFTNTRNIKTKGGIIMSFRKTFVCLARSRKYGGCCIAGKTASSSGYGNWIRPTGTNPGGALIERETCLDDGSTAALLDLVTVHIQEKDEEVTYQAENYRICRGIPWKKEGTVHYGKIGELADKPETLWKNNYSSGAGMNDFVPVSMLGGTAQSLYLIRPFALKLLRNLPGAPEAPSPYGPSSYTEASGII